MRSLFLVVLALVLSLALCAHASAGSAHRSPKDALLSALSDRARTLSSSTQLASAQHSSKGDRSATIAGLDAPRPSAPRASTGDFSATISAALQRITESQQNVTTPFLPPWSQYKLAGVYPSFIHLNFVGGPAAQAARELIGIYDSNGFVTSWVTQMLLESALLGSIALGDETVFPAVNTTLQFHDHSATSDGSAVQDFWGEVFVNGSWSQSPANLVGPISMLQPLGVLLGEWCATDPAVCPSVRPIVAAIGELTDLMSAFGIPADFDDSGVNLALGSLLSRASAMASQSWNAWASGNGGDNLSPAGLFELSVAYSYRPFSSDMDANSIDPRSYYWLRPFLALEVARAGKEGRAPSLILATTWVDDITRSGAEFYTHYKMPFLTNNVDGSVVANALYGIVSSLLLHAPLDGSGDYATFWNESTVELQQLTTDSARLLAWIIDLRVLLDRPDIALLYYPPFMDFFYFTSRTLHALASVNLDQLFGDVYGDSQTVAILQSVQKMLGDALQGEGTKTIASLAQAGVSPSSSLPYAFWDQFLGNADLNAKNVSTPHYDDRLFSTAVAANALLTMWTVDDATAGLVWVKGASAEAVSLAMAACNFLDEQLVADIYKPDNSFFSGSVKGDTTLPFPYPVNLWRFYNGTTVPPAEITWDTISPALGCSFSGVVSEAEYQQMIATNPLGPGMTPTSFGGYNKDGVGMVYWSSPPLTYAAGILALSKCALLPATPSLEENATDASIATA